MKIEFVDGDFCMGMLNGTKCIEKGKEVLNVGKFYHKDKLITIVRQKYWYMTLFILFHELIHFIINCLFPYENIAEFTFDRGKNNNPILENGIYLTGLTREIHPWHCLLDKHFKIPGIWR